MTIQLFPIVWTSGMLVNNTQRLVRHIHIFEMYFPSLAQTANLHLYIPMSCIYVVVHIYIMLFRCFFWLDKLHQMSGPKHSGPPMFWLWPYHTESSPISLVDINHICESSFARKLSYSNPIMSITPQTLTSDAHHICLYGWAVLMRLTIVRGANQGTHCRYVMLKISHTYIYKEIPSLTAIIVQLRLHLTGLDRAEQHIHISTSLKKKKEKHNLFWIIMTIYHGSV